jgi:hypothetical protein
MKVALLVVVVVVGFAFLYGSGSAPEKGTCAADFTKCVDNSDVVNNYSKMPDAISYCVVELNHSTRFGDPEWSWTEFESYRPGTDTPKTGVVKIIDSNVKIPNAFGGKVSSKVECSYDFNRRKAQIVSVYPR